MCVDWKGADDTAIYRAQCADAMAPQSMKRIDWDRSPGWHFQQGQSIKLTETVIVPWLYGFWPVPPSPSVEWLWKLMEATDWKWNWCEQPWFDWLEPIQLLTIWFDEILLLALISPLFFFFHVCVCVVAAAANVGRIWLKKSSELNKMSYRRMCVLSGNTKDVRDFLAD